MRVGVYRERKKCALCLSSNLSEALNLGFTPLANEYVKTIEKEQDLFPLVLDLCGDCGHLQMGTIVEAERLFRHYVYVSGTSEKTVSHFEQQAKTVAGRFLNTIPEKSLVVEIGSNDGTALRSWQKLGVTRVLGVDPAFEIARKAEKDGVPTRAEFFDEALAKEIAKEHGRADVIIANNVFAHSEDLTEILRGVEALLTKDGVFVIEVSYLRDIVDELAFDTIYHEHFSYHALSPLVKAANKFDLEVCDVEWDREQLGRGSLRVYIKRARQGHVSSAVGGVMKSEERANLFDASTYSKLKVKIEEHGNILVGRLNEFKSQGHTICGFGAAAKLTTLMYVFDIGREMCEFVVDDSPLKQGLFTPGKHIPIRHPNELLSQKAPICVVYAWNFYESVVKRFQDYPGIFVIPLPDYQEIETDETPLDLVEE